ncbi:DNA-binding protein [Streptomyces chrestomyceticus JCM 4735]|uniref:DNA-binding protein n=1 Tax=Streptomyces chrestomyceticus JCM 4735 TaxID=1306181 RepID=A0A7U9KVK8_9ACTN|nr:DNA-binding protein [Streptomyces chrestomyceticus JCM 4735]
MTSGTGTTGSETSAVGGTGAPASADGGTDDELYLRLKAFEGQAAVTVGEGKDPVNEPMIRHWCEAMGDTSPAYQGPDAVAPPTMLQAWTMGGLSGHPGRSTAHEELFALLDEAGCTSVVATDCEQEYLRPLRPGDHITFDSVIESVSPRKTTKLGAGYFVTTRMDVRADGEPAGTHRFRILKYAPAGHRDGRGPRNRNGRSQPSGPEDRAGSPHPQPHPHPRPVINRDNAGFWAGVARHELLIQRCTACAMLRFPWLPGCNNCGGEGWDTVAAAGSGTVFSYVVMHHPPFPAFDPPYAVGLVELAEGVRVVAGVVGVPPEEVRIGMPVRLEFRTVDEDLVLPVFSGRPGPVQPGCELPPLTVPVTRTLIVAGAIASRDYQDVHHDTEAARDRGSPDIFMNILTTNGLAGRYITDFFGPRAVLRKVAIRLGVPNYPGDVLELRGTVLALDGDTAEVRVVGTNRLGHHVTGTVTVTVPGTAPEPAP